MNTRFFLFILAMTGPLAAQDAAPKEPATEPPKEAAPSGEQKAPEPPKKRSLLKYTPPKDTASGQRIDGDGGSRNEQKIKIPNFLCTLTPAAGAALTSQASPSLFSYVSDPVNMEFRVTINEPNESKPSFIFAVSQCAAGIHRVNLADYGVVLKPGVEYKWTVAVRPDPQKRSADLPATGLIKRTEPDAALAEKLKAAPAADHAAIYAEAGIWYDALASLADQIAANPGDAELLAMRAEFLKAVGLDKVKVANR